LQRHRVDAGKRHRGGQAAVLGHRVEEPDLWEFDGEVREEDEEGALPLFERGGDFLLGGVSGDDGS
jgi:hypothetical protein